jgi:hypothetical protein
MNKHFLVRRSILCVLTVCVLAGASCAPAFTAMPTPTVVPTATVEPLRLINGLLNACLLLTPEEVESVLGDEVIGKPIHSSWSTGCAYYLAEKTDEGAILLVDVVTETTIKGDNFLKSAGVDSAEEDYELLKFGEKRFEKNTGLIKVEDIENLGDRAYMSIGSSIAIHVLNNDIFYSFSAFIQDGINFDRMLKLTRIAMQRMPE